MATLPQPRPLVLIGLLLGCTALSFYVGLVLHISIVYTHLFYIPIVLGGLWYPRQSLYPALYLGILHLGVEYTGAGVLEISVIARAGSFLLVGGLVGLIAGRIQRGDQASIQYMSSYAERVSTPRTRIMSTFDGVRMSLGMNMDVERMRERQDTAGLVRTLRHSNAEIRYQAVDALGTLKDPATSEALAQSLRDPDCGVRWKAAEALGNLGMGALPHLISALEDPATDVRWRAALALGDTGQEGAIPALTGVLSDPDPYVRGRAVVALSGFGEPAFQYLYQTVKKGEIQMNEGVIRAFGRMGDPGLSMLGNILREHSLEESLVSSLEEAFLDQGLRSAPLLVDVLTGSNDSGLRVLAVRTLGRLGDVRVLDALLRSSTSDSDETVRRETEIAIRRLKRIPGPISK